MTIPPFQIQFCRTFIMPHTLSHKASPHGVLPRFSIVLFGAPETKDHLSARKLRACGLAKAWPQRAHCSVWLNQRQTTPGQRLKIGDIISFFCSTAHTGPYMDPTFSQHMNFAPTFSNMSAIQATTPSISEIFGLQVDTEGSTVDANNCTRRYPSTTCLHAVTAVEADIGPPLKKRIVELPEVNNAHNSVSAFAALYTDVHEHIISWLPTSSLAALMATCHYFSEVSLKPLCKRSRQPFKVLRQLSSFLCFLRAGSAYPRWPLIQELNIYLRREQGSEQQDVFNALLRIAYLCRGLRRLRLGVFSWRASEMDSFVQAVSELPLLEDLHMLLSLLMTTPLNFRKLLCPKLRILSVYHDTGRPSRAYYKIENLALPSTLTEMHLLDIIYWTIPTGFTLMHLRRLTIEMPEQITSLLGLGDAFPNLRDLTVGGRGIHASSCLFDDNIELARVEAGKQWALHPEKWPTLAVLETDVLETAYVLCVPSYVSRLSFPYNNLPYMPRSLDYMRTAVADAQPVCLTFDAFLVLYQLHWKDVRDQNIYDFSFMHASQRLKQCIVNVKERAAGCYVGGRPSSNGHLRVLGGLVQALPQAHTSLTHLLVTYLPDNNRGFINEARLQESVDFKNGAKKTAMLLANASPTLQWIGIYVKSCSLISFVVKRDFIRTDGVLTLEEMSEDRGWAIMEAEEMDFVRCIRDRMWDV
ncbi:hypothetical protein C8Q78DRAFT_402529 [Trametes maxima]|nr:hypothetical protein C8Q78DRAFT_402529 [Trametes maxima]